ncbi:NAD-dependent epimerase/dehydratase family protein [Myroides odoratimimus]|uniref:NAD-dependent epimerase/dehydratase family protein n=1 Tax=Myroides TaxID=76831 RepID=UPI002097847D|nr:MULTISPECIES: NAD-dependent epimerase/dehydratase family protein [Myroides]MCO7721752.1 NAD-dependent epimerase/dehydratase family protein [Myroides odoratimimus]MDM1057910.1 NAD-dependent epimerase/dehydratase family protein [Myroides odoratimimus]MDM1098218.1 NAD-dependent epimerase/dehydratase family protein [Myroides odoratimimus]MDM1409832.1 NAD-dependent epimerase/dehydratase family protein [Myroides odoratimimus]MDM1414129.1 NAD-dependent epimerase/dehydratase family protein [Myroide
MGTKILIIGACGQIGSELTLKLRDVYGSENVIASDIREGNEALMSSGPFETLNAMEFDAVAAVIEKHQVEEVYLMAALLSATAEKNPAFAWDLNMNSLFHVLNLAKEGKIKKIFWPSSIAVFGPTTPRHNTPQYTVMEPSTVYGISKQTGERWCEYYYNKFGVDVRSIRYPGLISWTTPPGGGTTDYAVDIFYKAIEDKHYDCFLSEGSALPMMYMEDALNATVGIMQAKKEDVKIRSSYNLGGISFTPEEIAAEIAKHIPDFTIEYNPDFRQAIADSWPASIDDTSAQQDWGWNHKYDLSSMTEVMLENLTRELKK